LKSYYQLLNITDSYFSNALSQAQFGVYKAFDILKTGFIREEWLSPTNEVNAFYDPSNNRIIVPSAIQQFPMFSTAFPSYILFGGMGVVAGHEVVHGFDDTGSKYGPDGSLTNWWTNSSLAAYKERAKCFVEQFNQYTVPLPNGSTTNIDGQLTLGENIADAGGLNLAFESWQNYQTVQKRKRSDRVDVKLPGLEHFSDEQLFFLRWGQSWCLKATPENLESVLTDSHSPNPVRVPGSLANSAQFKKAFNCPNKKPACELW
jgi:endothelin-converting enzyme